ncbi:hypothetical protein bcere0010_40300 [Bacillus cereus ATCC 4342]|nr:hypothetical protein bcere0010_40300 [Bacillus cereus ATCC 4342]
MARIPVAWHTTRGEDDRQGMNNKKEQTNKERKETINE